MCDGEAAGSDPLVWVDGWVAVDDGLGWGCVLQGDDVGGEAFDLLKEVWGGDLACVEGGDGVAEAGTPGSVIGRGYVVAEVWYEGAFCVRRGGE